MRSLQKLVMALMVGGAGAGCSKWVEINSTPQGARCFVNGTLRGSTPLRTVVESTALGPNPLLRLERKGYDDYVGILKKKAQPGNIAADLLLGGLGLLAMTQNAALVSGDYYFDLDLKESRISDRSPPGRVDGAVRTTRDEVAPKNRASADQPRSRTRRVRRRSKTRRAPAGTTSRPPPKTTWP